MKCNKLSIIIQITDDNELALKHNVENLSFANEIIVICRTPIKTISPVSLHIIQEKDNLKKSQKKAIKLAQNDWIIIVYSNQYISKDLKVEIEHKINNSNSYSYFYAKETLFFFGKTIRFGTFFNKKKLFLFKKTRYDFDKKKTFLDFLFNKTVILKNDIKLHSYLSFDDYNCKLNQIRKEEALVLFKQNVKPNFYHFFLKPFFNFINQYFLKLGIIDGKEGFILAYINSFSILKRYLVLWLLYRNME